MKGQNTAALKALAAGRLPAGTTAKGLPRLRFDRVAQRLVKSLQAALVGLTSANTSVVLTVTAPIRLPARTVAELSVRLRSPPIRAFDKIVCGNRVRARIVRSHVRGAPKVIVFVHNPQPPPTGLFKLVEGELSGTPVRDVQYSQESDRQSGRGG